MSTPVRVWDLPTRLFHWALAISIVLGIVFVKIGGNAIQWHAYCGYAALALILFRLIWGFVGSWHARFANFIPSPSRLITFLRGETDGGLGHNPLGALSVIALLAVVLIQALTGLFADDDIFFRDRSQNTYQTVLLRYSPVFTASINTYSLPWSDCILPQSPTTISLNEKIWLDPW